MEFTLKIVLSADKDLLAAIQNLAGVTVTGAAPDAPVISMNGEQNEKRRRITKKAEDAAVGKPETTLHTGTEKMPDLAPSEEVKTEHTMESLRDIAVPKSRAGKKDEIKAKLTEMGYPNGLATLQPKDFDAFHKFITQL